MATAPPEADLPEGPVPAPAMPGAGPPPAAAAALYRVPLAIYNRMGELGLLTRADRVVLLDALPVERMTRGPLHACATLAALDLLKAHLPAGYHARPEPPIELRPGPAGDGAPEPDLAVVRGARADYRERHPGADVLLVVEVADSSLRLDREGLRRYAWAGIPTAWVVNLRAGAVEVHTGPSGPTDDPGYAAEATRAIGEMLDLALDGGRVEGLPVADLFG